MPGLQRIRALAQEFRESPAKAAWLRDQIRWRYFTFRHRGQAKANLAFDRRFGVDTATDVPLELAGVPAADVARGNGIYRALTESVFRSAIAAVPADLTEYVFIDIGSGKGKVLMLAADYPFREILGIEYASALHDIAVRNLAAYRSPRQQCASLRAVHADALTYPLPDGPLLVFVFNALAPPFMRALLESLNERAGRRPQDPLIVIYTNIRNTAEMGAVFDSLASLDIMTRHRNHVVLMNDAARRGHAA